MKQLIIGTLSALSLFSFAVPTLGNKLVTVNDSVYLSHIKFKIDELNKNYLPSTNMYLI